MSEVKKILADRDYDVYNVEGGLDAIPKVHFVDAKGLSPGHDVFYLLGCKHFAQARKSARQEAERCFFARRTD